MHMRAAIKSDLDDSYWTPVCQLDALIIDGGLCAVVERTQVALFRLSGLENIYAIDNFDPFSGANVLSRGVVGDLEGKIVVASPVYKQHFNLVTGQCLEDECVKLTTYATRIVDGVVQVALR
jgi:NAD(P)H-dependent nitrite reductase small subunit